MVQYLTSEEALPIHEEEENKKYSGNDIARGLVGLVIGSLGAGVGLSGIVPFVRRLEHLSLVYDFPFFEVGAGAGILYVGGAMVADVIKSRRKQRKPEQNVYSPPAEVLKEVDMTRTYDTGSALEESVGGGNFFINGMRITEVRDHNGEEISQKQSDRRRYFNIKGMLGGSETPVIQMSIGGKEKVRVGDTVYVYGIKVKNDPAVIHGHRIGPAYEAVSE
jgi:hypothetical protein